MNLDPKLTGGLAVGAALAVAITHSEDFTVEEFSFIAAGIGAVVTYGVKMVERLFFGGTNEG